MISLPEDFVILKFFELGYYPKYNKFNNVYQCSCPICKEGKCIHIGYYDDVLVAAEAYNKKALELFGEFSKLNEVSE